MSDFLERCYTRLDRKITLKGWIILAILTTIIGSIKSDFLRRLLFGCPILFVLVMDLNHYLIVKKKKK